MPDKKSRKSRVSRKRASAPKPQKKKSRRAGMSRASHTSRGIIPAASHSYRVSRSLRISRASRGEYVSSSRGHADSGPRKRFSHASSSMTLTDLQFLAKSRGIPFGGLTKTRLVRKINNY